MPLLAVASIGLLVAFVFAGIALAGEDPSASRIAGSWFFAISGFAVAWLLGMNIAMAIAALVFGVHA